MLESGAAYAALVFAEPSLAGARALDLLRVVPEHPEQSFLMIKLTEPSSAALGSRMPLVGNPLSDAEIEMVRTWILEGAAP